MKPIICRMAGAAAVIALIYACASVGRIEGGPIDEAPPRYVRSVPDAGATEVSRKRISIEFDEFIKLDKPGEKIVISPPQVQQPEIKANGRRVVVTLQDTLKEDATYSIDFADAITDNNEGNPLSDFGFTFSTGKTLDSMRVSGTVLNASNLEPVKGLLVGLHANLADSAFTSLPFERIGRTDSRGRFTIRGIAPGKYRIYALQDADRNYYYNQPTEIIAFADSLILPAMEERTRFDTVWKDTLTVDTIIEKQYMHYLPDDILLCCFKEVSHTQRLLKGERPEARKFSLFFTAPADSLPLLRGLNFNADDAFVVEQPTGRNDTIHYWVKDSLVYKLDTLKMSLTYLHTDSLKQLTPRTDTLKLLYRARKAAKEKEEKKRKKNDEQEAEPVRFLSMDVYAPAAMDVYDYISLSFTEPVSTVETSAIHLTQKVDTLSKNVPFDFVRDTLDIKRYNLYADWIPGESYSLTIDSTAVHGLYGLFTDKVQKQFKVKKPEEYGQIFFNLSDVNGPAFVELLDAQDKVVRTVTVADSRADFYYLNPGKYCARLVEDTNANGEWDTGNYAEKRQAERVYYYTQVLELKANFDLTQEWSIKAKAPDKQKPEELKKQKPDEDKKRNRNARSQNNRR